MFPIEAKLIPLKVAVIDQEPKYMQVLRAIARQIKGVRVKKVTIFKDIKDASNTFNKNEFNCIFIDLFSIGTREGYRFIARIRDSHKHIPICLYSKTEDFKLLPDRQDIPVRWRKKFIAHYYKVEKDNVLIQRKAIETTLAMCSKYILSKKLRKHLPDMKDKVEKKEHKEVIDLLLKILDEGSKKTKLREEEKIQEVLTKFESYQRAGLWIGRKAVILTRVGIIIAISLWILNLLKDELMKLLEIFR